MKKSSGGNRKKCRAWKITRNILLGVIGLWAVILIILQIVLTPGVLTNLANNFAAGMVDGNVEADRAILGAAAEIKGALLTGRLEIAAGAKIGLGLKFKNKLK